MWIIVLSPTAQRAIRSVYDSDRGRSHIVWTGDEYTLCGLAADGWASVNETTFAENAARYASCENCRRIMKARRKKAIAEI